MNQNIQNLIQELQKNKEQAKKEFDSIKYVENKKKQPMKLEDMQQHIKRKPKEEIYNDLKHRMKASWRDPGYTNSEFNKIPVLRANLLRNWDFDRLYMSQRSYKYPPNYKGIKIPTCPKEFGEAKMELLPEQFQQHLKEDEVKKEHWRFRPSQYGKIYLDYKLEKINMNNKENFKYTNVSSNYFGIDKHSTWEKEIKNSRFLSSLSTTKKTSFY